MTHRPAVYQTQDICVGTCNCGWLGPDRPNATEARQDAARHAIEATRNAQKPPIKK